MAEKGKSGIVTPPSRMHMAIDVPLTNPLEVLSTYANDVGVAFTMTDVRLMFAEVGPTTGDFSTGQKILKANVVIPLQQAAALAQWMLGALEQHRKDIEAVVADAAKPKKS